MRTITKPAALAALLAASALTFGQNIYTPNSSLEDQHITLKYWGSGTVAESDQLAYDGTTSIRVSSRNFFQGGIIIFDSPIDLSQAASDRNNMFHLTIQSPGSGTTFSPRSGNQGAPGTGTDLGEGPGTTGRRGRSNYEEVTLRKVRCVITTTDNMKSEVYIDLTSAIPTTRGWKQVGIPLISIPGFDRTNKIIKSLAFSGDTFGTFYIGEIKIINDTTPLYVEPNVRELNLALGDEYTLFAYGSGGSTMLRYTWDFNDADGVHVDAEGIAVKRKFRKDGTYTITLTVHDAFGLKKPYSTTIKVVVNP
ncbi:MAG: PKD domain-containing protein [Armatimonadetes bacterium]|nr:PKD domain-containing protein [Armatimonadota bacterium]